MGSISGLGRPHVEHVSPGATTTKPVLWNPPAATTEAHVPSTHAMELPLSATRESLSAAMKTQHSQKKKKPRFSSDRQPLTSFALCGKRAQRKSETLCEGCPMVTATNSATLHLGSLLREISRHVLLSL